MKLILFIIAMLIIILGIGNMYTISEDEAFALTYGYVFGGIIMHILSKPESNDSARI